MIPPVLRFEDLPIGTLFFRLSTGQDDQRHVAERMFALRPLGPQTRELFVLKRVDGGGDVPHLRERPSAHTLRVWRQLVAWRFVRALRELLCAGLHLA